MELKIYDKQGLVKMTVSPDNSSQWSHEVGVENVVTVNFTTWEFLVLEVGWYILVEGQRFSIKSEYRPKHIHDTKYTYNLKFYGREHDAQDILFCRLNQGEDDLESVFAYDGTPMDFLQKVVANMNRNTDGVVWKAGEAISANRQTINFNGLYCWDALGEIARAFGTEWWMDGEYLNISKCERGESVSLGYGKGLKSGLTQNENTNAVKWFTRLIPVGSSKNIDKSKYGYATLQLPGREKYIDINTQYGLKEYREEAAFSEIYPHRVGTISSVRSEERTNEETGNYTVYFVKDSSLPFNPDEYMIGGEVIHMTFNSGALAGKDFEVNWNNETKEFEIINQYPDENTQLPGGNLVPSADDTYVLWNISMPWNYIDAAEIKYKEAVEAFLSEYSKDISVYSGSTDYIYISKNNVPLLLGQRVRLLSEIYFGNIGRDSRITRVSRKLNNLNEATIDCSDAIASSWKSSVDSSLNQLQFVYASQKNDTTNKDLHILQTGDTNAPSDYNVYSALRSNRTFLRKDIPDETPYSLGVGGLKFQKKPINRFIRYYDEDKPEEVSDADFYSALATDMKIEESLGNLDKRYLRKDKEDTAQKHIEFLEGITVHQMAEMENIDVEVLARIAKAFVTQIGSEKFVDGFFGEGYQIWKAIATGDWNFTIDRLTVRKVMTVYELIVQKIRSVGGMVVVSAGNGKVKDVEQVGLEYKFTFEDENTFQEHDLMRCQVWTGSGVKYYWVEVVRVEDGAVYTRVADFAGVEPSAGDEVVLMGNTQNPLRQGLVLISAAEDGQPRVDVLDGVKTTNFDDCLKARLGGLDGITDSRFPADLQPQGYGLYSNNCYLTGVFVLSNGKDVQTQFAIMEGMIRANMSSIQQQINAEDNYLSNASMTTNLIGWEFNNDVKVFRTSGGLLHFNGNFYAIKNAIAGIVPNGEKIVLRLKNSFIRQKNASLAMHPTFDLVEQMTTDADGKEVGTGVMLYRPRMFYVSFRYMVTKRGTLRVYFENEQKRDDFEEYEPLNYTKVLEVGNSFMVTDDFLSGKWNGTGDFYLSFDGDMYLYDLALSDDPLSDMEERWSMQLEITEKKIQANAEHIIQQGQDLQEYRSEFLYTAEQLRTEFTSLVQNEKEDITEAYTGLVAQTAQSLESDYTAKIGNYYGKVTEEYNSKITQTAKDITTTLNAKIDATDKAIGDLEVGLKADYDAKISASATSLQSDYNSKITNLRTGDIANLQSSIEQQAGLIATKVSQTDFNALGVVVGGHTSSITQLSNRIEAVASSVKTDASGNITNISTSGLVLDSEFASMFLTQVNSQGIAKTAQLSAYVLEDDLGDLVSKIDISADQIDLTGAVTYSDLSFSMKGIVDGKAESSDLEALENSLSKSIGTLNETIGNIRTDVDAKAAAEDLEDYVEELTASLENKTNTDLSNAVLNGTTFILNGLIRTKYIDVENLVVQKLEAEDALNDYSFSLDKNGFEIKDTYRNRSLVYLTGDSTYGSTLQMWNIGQSRWVYLNPQNFTMGHSSSYGIAIDMNTGLMNLNNGLKIKNFGIDPNDFTVVSSTTFNVSNISVNKWSGRMYFYYFTNECTVSGLAAGSVKCKYGTIFINNGSTWYHFSSKY